MCVSKNKVKESVNLRIGRIWEGLERGKGSGEVVQFYFNKNV